MHANKCPVRVISLNIWIYFICVIFTCFCCNASLVRIILKNTAYCVLRMHITYGVTLLWLLSCGHLRTCVLLPALPVILSGRLWEAVSMLFCDLVLFCLYQVAQKRYTHASLPSVLASLWCMATLWRPFVVLLNPLSLRLIYLVRSLMPPAGPPFQISQIRWAMGSTCCEMSCRRLSSCLTVSFPMLTNVSVSCRVYPDPGTLQ